MVEIGLHLTYIIRLGTVNMLKSLESLTYGRYHVHNLDEVKANVDLAVSGRYGSAGIPHIERSTATYTSKAGQTPGSSGQAIRVADC